MPPKDLPKSEVSRNVAINVSRFRALRRLTGAELADRLAAQGRPLSRATVSEIENMRRRVDVDDLVALSIALDVPVVSLLMPPTYEPAAAVQMVGDRLYDAATVWAALRGEGTWDGDWVDPDIEEIETMKRMTWPDWCPR
ncbi:helix-turn-helix domain-containing protein [Gordonia sp. (in: high G+C Gram-positive bacteria)]|uniref:helix-turn-helix domain-containing protein n=1 Tax=Gordonia sp. (in: high G+C Gram-positive bacteria) TaxID=84139 RepID=UPI0039E27D79